MVSIISKAKTDLNINHPFFGCIAMKYPTEFGGETIYTDGSRIIINEQWAETVTRDQLAGAIANSVSKIAYMHPIRRGARDKKLWEAASNFAVNHILIKSGFSLPPGALDDKRFHGLSAEQVYSILEKEKENNHNNNNNKDNNKNGSGTGENEGEGEGKASKASPGGDGPEQPWGGMGDHPDSDTEAGRSRAETEARIQTIQAVLAAKSRGKIPIEFESLIEKFQEPKIDWRERLRTFVGGNVPDDYSYRRPNRKIMAMIGAYTPTIEYRGAGHIVIGVDSSGSVGKKEMEQFLSEIKAIHDEMRPERTTVIWCDAAIQHVDVYEQYDEFNDKKRYGMGGTVLSPVFEYVRDNNMQCDSFVFLTDLCVDLNEFVGLKPDYPVLWVSTALNQAPFGDVVKIDVNE